jgi:peptide/nickel transport system substrate-binding protein
MRRVAHRSLAAVVAGAAGFAVLFATALGSAGAHTATVAAVPTTGVGLTTPTTGTGAKVSGGTVYFNEAAQTPPNYIFPMTSAQVCGIDNIDQLNAMLYRPLYWYGNNYRPTIDYNYSVGKPPVFSNGNTVVTVTLNPWKWSDGEAVTSRDIALWINLYKADPATNYCGYVKGYFPDNVKSVSTPNAQTVVLHLTGAYNPTWFTYNELSQIYPLPLAWDRTSLSHAAPKSDNGHLPDTTKAGAEAVYKFLDTQSKAVSSWATSPVWGVVDGPFKLTGFTTSGQVTLVPNPSYSGSPKPSISKLVELPFTSDTAIYNQIRSGGPSALTIASLPAQYAPQISTVAGEGYALDSAASYSFNYFPLNLNNPTVGPIFRQVYFRQALQHLIDQEGWIHAFLFNTAVPTYSPIPNAPPSPLVPTSASGNPFPFSTAPAAQLLSSHGWKVVPGGTDTCRSPGTGPKNCGAGIKAGQALTFDLQYQGGVAVVQSEMNDLLAQATKVGIKINMTAHPFNTIIGEAIACQPTQPTCKWEALNWGGGWIYGPDFLPTGESLFLPGAVANYESYSDPTATKLIQATITASAAQEPKALVAYSSYMEQQVPVVYGPTSVGIYGGSAGVLVSKHLGGFAANTLGYMTPEAWYFTK